MTSRAVEPVIGVAERRCRISFCPLRKPDKISVLMACIARTDIFFAASRVLCMTLKTRIMSIEADRNRHRLAISFMTGRAVCLPLMLRVVENDIMT